MRVKTRDNTPIDKILAATDIVDLINETTPLEKKGKNHMGLCPFHDEKTPSFSVNREKGVYYCFGCHASGNALTFVKDQKNLSTNEALRHLAERADIKVELSAFAHKHQKYYDINYEAMQFFKVYLHHMKEGEAARKYLEKRGLDRETIERFDIGLAPGKRDALFRALSNKGLAKTEMVDLGLVNENEKGEVYDGFRNRVMFPIQNEEGQVVGFSGRTYKDDGKATAKYMNSPESVIFKKNRILYNIHRARRAVQEKKRLVLFEGFMDVIMADKAGVAEGTAVMGTALTEAHAIILGKAAKRLVLCFDGDDAGREAVRRFLGDLRKRAFETRVAPMPAGLDPDDFIRKKGAEAFREALDNAQSARDFLYDDALREADLSDIGGKERFKEKVFALIKPASALEQTHYLKRLAQDLDVGLATLEEDFRARKAPEKAAVPTYEKAAFPLPDQKFKKAERGFIHYFLKDEYYARKFLRDFDAVTYVDKRARDIQLEIFELYEIHPQSCIHPGLFAARLTKRQREYFEEHVRFTDYPYNEDEFEDFLRVMHEYVKRNRIENLKKRKAETHDIQEKIRYQKKIDAINMEVKHGQGKNHPGAH